jgi:hypothetical protein
MKPRSIARPNPGAMLSDGRCCADDEDPLHVVTRFQNADMSTGSRRRSTFRHAG